LTFLNCKVAHSTLNSFDIVDMQVYFLLKNVQLFFHFNLKIVATGLNFSEKLLAFFFLITL
jgi:hypothetical protein